MGAMQSLAAGWLFPERVGKVVSISGTARSSPSAIAMRFAQRSGELWVQNGIDGGRMLINYALVLMADPNWNKGYYYGGLPPHTGMKLARRESFLMEVDAPILMRIVEIATITYRSGPEWDQRFGRKMRPIPTDERPAPAHTPRVPALCPDFLIETYLDYQVSL